MSVDQIEKKRMLDFIYEFLRYPTMNYWNNSYGYARNIKIPNLGIEDNQEYNNAYTIISSPELWQEFEFYMRDIIRDFHMEHPEYNIIQNGRSGGYLVLVNSKYIGRSTRIENPGESLSNESIKDLYDLLRDFDFACNDIISTFKYLCKKGIKEEIRIIEEKYLVFE